MTSEELPEHARTLLSDHVRSVDDLKVLLALIEAAGRWWDIRSMSEFIGVPLYEAGRALEALASANLLDIRVSDEVRYQLRPGTPVLEQAVESLTSAYRLSPGAILRFVTGRARGDTASFADAFRFRR